MPKRVVVIGGGAAGMMAAGQAAAGGANVILLDKMKRLGSKIAISGKGRCNLTNAGDISSFISYYPGNGKFLYAALKEFDNEALIRFFKKYGVDTKVERGGRVFPIADDSEVIITALKKFLTQNGVEIRLNQTVTDIIVEEGKTKGVHLAGNDEIVLADVVIVAAGGASYPGTGSTGDGFTMAVKTGHKVIKPLPALVPLKTAEHWPKALQGLTLKNVSVSLWVDGKKQGDEFGEMLFTHFGVSGPIILTLSRMASKALDQKQRVDLKLNLKPALTPEQMDLRLQRDFAKYSNKQFANALDDLLPQSFIPVMVDLSGIAPEKVVNKITKEERKKLCRLFQDLPMKITATLGMATAIVTCGGVDVKQINPTTMESRRVKGLFFAGEVIDIDGVTGGYNLQAAFATGYKAGNAAVKYL
ncbi:NAD(P)/FAD-dependent oxidoreductase [Dehalobacter sp. DCM]|uniref:NAD(P)/FAD-dependent oxidoreductase n=1 Tax=Dehalobacter sp. DCM TaxID=2907827 RepID=UPI00308175D4|nr:NAD(P)/FAD-dependent oxidoreductase [Dehalobacter sp. DCM]